MGNKVYSPEFRRRCMEMGQNGEELFQSLTQATKGSKIEDYNHVDFFWGEKRVDVKGYKPSHQRGFILLEMVNVQGRPGWCSKDSQATHIAFQMSDCFYIFEKESLREFVLEKCGRDVKVLREDGLARKRGYNNILYMYLGREYRRDIFCYVKLEDLLSSVDFEVLSFDNK